VLLQLGLQLRSGPGLELLELLGLGRDGSGFGGFECLCLGLQLFDLGIERLDLGFDLLVPCVEGCSFEADDLLL
jgi:hypothetical protein